jgi:hypothetical protein
MIAVVGFGFGVGPVERVGAGRDAGSPSGAGPFSPERASTFAEAALDGTEGVEDY